MTTVPHGIRLTRAPRWDGRNLNFPVSLADGIPKSKSHVRYVYLNQGDTPACTGYSGATALAYAPHAIHTDSGLNAFAARLYKQNQMFDEWPGENYEGSSVLGCMQALKHFGFIGRYEWALDSRAVAVALNHRPVILGIDWYTAMFTPDTEGVIELAGVVEGGHAIAVGAQKNYGEWFRLDNTWGEDWGLKGSAWFHKDDVDTLLSTAHQGEAAVPHKVGELPALAKLTVRKPSKLKK